MTIKQLLHIGPPFTAVGGMVTTLRRKQIDPAHSWKIRNLRILEEAWTRIKGNARLLSGALPSTSLKSDGQPATYVQIAKTDTSDITDYDLGTRWTVFCAYRLNTSGSDAMIISHGDESPNPPWRITHNSDGSITAIVTDTSPVTLTTATNYTLPGRYEVQLVRSGATATLYVKGVSAATNSNLSATANTRTSSTNIYQASWTGNPSGSPITLYETRIFREAYTDEEWRITQYPWTGAFGDPHCVLHLLFEEGSGSTLKDYSRVKNESITLAGNWTWVASSPRQSIAPVTGIEVFENARGRVWLIADIGKNHYRIPLR